jgi:hypothetical protein
MNNQNLENRVGYATLLILHNETKKYIVRHTINGEYVGDVQFLVAYQKNELFLETARKQFEAQEQRNNYGRNV